MIEGQMTIFDVYARDILCGRTSPAPCHRPENETGKITEGKTSKPSSQRSPESQNQTPPLFLYLKTGDGPNPVASWVTEQTDALFPSRGDYLTHSFGEQPNMLTDECSQGEPRNGVGVSRLSQILEESAPPKYYLSERACAGILRRAEKRKKELPEILEMALKAQAGGAWSIDEKMGQTYIHKEQGNTLAQRDYKQPQAVCTQQKTLL